MSPVGLLGTDSPRPPSPAKRTNPRRRTPLGLPWPALVAGVVGVLLLLGAGVYVRLTTNRLQGQIAAEFKAGQQTLESGKALLKTASATHDPGKVTAADTQFAAARQHFLAGRAIADRSRLLGFASAVPVLGGYVGTRVRAVDNLAIMGTHLSDAATTLAEVDLLLIKPGGTATAGGKLLNLLESSTSQLNTALSQLRTAQQAAKQIDASVLPTSERSALASARGTIDKGVTGIAALQQLAPALVDLLGGNGPRTYLVEQVNPAELRAGGGFIGTVSILQAEGGTFRLSYSGDTYAFDGATADARPTLGQAGYVAPPVSYMPDFFTRSWSLEDSNFFPSFATNAKWGEFFANHVRRVQSQGVIAMDYYAVAAMLEVTGPITLPGYDVTLTSANFAELVFQRSADRDPTHKAILAATAGPLVDRISKLPSDQWPKLADVLNRAILARHLQVYFNNASLEKAMRGFGWSPDVNPRNATDFMLETEDNYGATKTNHYVTRAYTVTLTKTNGGLHHKIVVDITDSAPPLPNGSFYSSYLRFYAADRATNFQLSRVPSAVIGTVPPADQAKFELPAGIKFVHTRFQISPRSGQPGHIVVTIEYDQPWTIDASGNHVIYWQKQPGTLDDSVDITWVDGGRTRHTSGTLGGDRLITLSASGVKFEPAQTATAQLPALGF